MQLASGMRQVRRGLVCGLIVMAMSGCTQEQQQREEPQVASEALKGLRAAALHKLEQETAAFMAIAGTDWTQYRTTERVGCSKQPDGQEWLDNGEGVLTDTSLATLDKVRALWESTGYAVEIYGIEYATPEIVGIRSDGMDIRMVVRDGGAYYTASSPCFPRGPFAEVMEQLGFQ